jgi:hypothetical protein
MAKALEERFRKKLTSLERWFFAPDPTSINNHQQPSTTINNHQQPSTTINNPIRWLQ